MIVVTGAAGFIGSNLVHRLNADHFKAIIAVDDFSHPAKSGNLAGASVQEYVHRDRFIDWLDHNHTLVEFVFHIGARTDTAEFDVELLNRLNTAYTKDIWRRCVKYQLPLVYASSAATYGLGEQGYDDDEHKIPLLKPLNPYGQSKQDFDVWALQQPEKPFFWAGLKFFNVYGPGEAHKGRMASVIWHAYNQIQRTGKIKLFKSHHPDFKDGEQMRDFVFVKDVVEVCLFFMHHRKNSGIYNLGSGKARTFNDLAKAVFHALNKPVDIEYIDTPIDIRDKYQYFTEAKMGKVGGAGFEGKLTPLEQGVMQYLMTFNGR